MTPEEDSGRRSVEKAQVREALDFLVELARGNDYADDRKVIEAQWTLEEALDV